MPLAAGHADAHLVAVAVQQQINQHAPDLQIGDVQLVQERGQRGLEEAHLPFRAAHVEAEARLHAELDAAGELPAPTLAQMEALPYTQQVVNEAVGKLAAAAAGERHDRALWTPLAAATGAAGNSTALVGTPETVAQAILDYIDLGVSTILIRGYDPYDDAIDYGRSLLPLVRAEVERRERQAVAA